MQINLKKKKYWLKEQKNSIIRKQLKKLYYLLYISMLEGYVFIRLNLKRQLNNYQH